MRSLEVLLAGAAGGAGAGAGLVSTAGTSLGALVPLVAGVAAGVGESASSSKMPFQAVSTALQLFKYSWYSSSASQSLSEEDAVSGDADMELGVAWTQAGMARHTTFYDNGIGAHDSECLRKPGIPWAWFGGGFLRKVELR